MRRNSFKYGAAATAFTVIFITALVLLNLIAGIMTDRFSLKLDVTENRMYEITDETLDFLAALTEDVSITVFGKESNYEGSPFYEIFQRYRNFSADRLTLRFLDSEMNPTVIEPYKDLGTVGTNSIIVESARRRRLLTMNDLIETTTDSYGQTSVTGIIAEQALTGALTYVLSEDIPRAVFTSGHEEQSASVLEKLLIDSNYVVETLNLAYEDLPDDTTLLIIAAPGVDFTTIEIDKIELFLKNGGNVMFFRDPADGDFERLTRYFSEWGASFAPAFVLDDRQAYGDYMHIIPNFEQQELLGELPSANRIMIAYASRPLTIEWTENGYRNLFPLVTSSASSYAKSFESLTETSTSARADDDKSGPFHLAAVCEENRRDSQTYELTTSRVIFCNFGIISDLYLNEPELSNDDFVNKLISYVSPGVTAVSIPARPVSTSPMSMPSSVGSVVFWLLVVLLPLALVIGGLLVWRKRKNL